MRVAAVPLLILGILVGVFYWLFGGDRQQPLVLSSVMSQRIELKTSDGTTIAGDYYAPAAGSPRGLLLLHMMPATRQSWKAFAETMQAAEWHVLAIDLRGHGESSGGPDGYKNFSDEEHQASRFDVEAGVGFLKTKGASELSLGGASIGANLALQYLAAHSEIRRAFLLSPGLDYRGVKTEPYARVLQSGQAVYYIASDDDRYSADTVRRLFDVTPGGVGKELEVFDEAGHGTAIFEREPQSMDLVVSWLQSL